MKKVLHGYYQPTEAEYQSLWKDSIVILDTNVILNLYKLPKSAREEFIRVLKIFGSRLWIPHQVALEYQRNRLSVISREKKITESAFQQTIDELAKIKSKVHELQIDKRGLDFDINAIIAAFEKAGDDLVESLKKVNGAQLEVSSEDIIRDEINSLFDGLVGSPPKDQKELDSICSDGDERYKNKIPPGYNDADKEKSPKDAAYCFDGVVYQRKFGDLIIWKQIINHAKAKSIKKILFITADLKDDWWWVEHNRTIGVHPQLSMELKRTSGVDLFWMYTADKFFEHANKYIKANVSSTFVDEVKSVADEFNKNQQFFHTYYEDVIKYANFDESINHLKFGRKRFSSRMEELVYGFIKSILPPDSMIDLGFMNFPDFIARYNGITHGFEFKVMNETQLMNMDYDGLFRAAIRGVEKVKSSELSLFSLVLSVPGPDIMDEEVIYKLKFHLSKLVHEFGIQSVFVVFTLDGRLRHLFSVNN